MRTDDACPCCGHQTSTAWPGLVAPFIADFVLNEEPSACNLLECEACGFRFFDRRFTDEEANHLYGGYRGETYFAARHRSEPWYTRGFNAALRGSGEVLRLRKQRVSRFLLQELQPERIERVLDYGGDSGHAIPDGWGRERVVYDLSDVPPAPGVVKHRQRTALVDGTFDLVMLSHVLEHVSDPAAVLSDVLPLLRKGTGAVMLEVPYERTTLGALGRGGLTRRYLDWLRRQSGPLLVADFVSTLARVKLGAFPPLGFPKLHEHINFYHERSLAALAERSGFRLLRTERAAFAPPAERGPVLVALMVARDA